MKKFGSIVVILASTTFISAAADPDLLAGPRLGKNTPAVVLASPNAGVPDPNLVAGPRLGKQTPDVRFAIVAGTRDANLLGGGPKCGMIPKFKDSAARSEERR